MTKEQALQLIEQVLKTKTEASYQVWVEIEKAIKVLKEEAKES